MAGKDEVILSLSVFLRSTSKQVAGLLVCEKNHVLWRPGRGTVNQNPHQDAPNVEWANCQVISVNQIEGNFEWR